MGKCEIDLAACNEQRVRLIDTVLSLEREVEGLKAQLAVYRKKRERSHGLTGYQAGCRCKICYETYSQYQLNYREARKAERAKREAEQKGDANES